MITIRKVKVCYARKKVLENPAPNVKRKLDFEDRHQIAANLLFWAVAIATAFLLTVM